MGEVATNLRDLIYAAFGETGDSLFEQTEIALPVLKRIGEAWRVQNSVIDSNGRR